MGCVEERRGEFGEGHICVFPSGVASENVPGQQDHRLGVGVDGHATDCYLEGRLRSYRREGRPGPILREGHKHANSAGGCDKNSSGRPQGTNQGLDGMSRCSVALPVCPGLCGLVWRGVWVWVAPSSSTYLGRRRRQGRSKSQLSARPKLPPTQRQRDFWCGGS